MCAKPPWDSLSLSPASLIWCEDGGELCTSDGLCLRYTS